MGTAIGPSNVIRRSRQRWFLRMTESVSESRPLSVSESERPEPIQPEPTIGPAPGAARAPRGWNWAGAIYATALAACGLFFLWLRKVHELTYPVPWPDEGSFLWPALAFRDRFSLFSPELFPSREVFWMPPGFMVLEGTVFKFWTFSLGRARMLSALFLLGSLGCVAAMLKTSRARIGHALIFGVFLFSPIFQLAGNTARMECLVLFVVGAGFALMHAKRWAGFGVLALAPLVHPIGVLFLAAGALYWFAGVRKERIFHGIDKAALGAAALCWVAYAVHLIPNFRWFYEDMSGQLKFKHFVSEANGGVVGRIGESIVLFSSVVIGACVPVARQFGARVGALATLAAASLLACALTEGWLYDIYPAFGALLTSLLLLECGAAYVARKAGRFGGVRSVVTLGALAAVILFVDAKGVVLNPFLLRSVQSSTAQAWTLDPSYLSEREHGEVADYLRSIGAEGGKTTVQFLPDADALLFEDVRSASLGFTQQTFYVTKPDVFILHRSPWFPPFIYEVELMGFVLRNGVRPKLDEWHEISRGNADAKWIVIRKPPGKIEWR